MTRKPKRVDIEGALDSGRLISELESTKEPVILEKAGKAVAALISPEDFEDLPPAPPSAEARAKALKLAGAWDDLNGEELIEGIYKWRHESPPRPPVRFD